jgi:hypothetical protein
MTVAAAFSEQSAGALALWLTVLAPIGAVVGAALGAAFGLITGLVLYPFRGRIRRMPLATAVTVFILVGVPTAAWLILHDVPMRERAALRVKDAVVLLIPLTAASIAAAAAKGVEPTSPDHTPTPLIR